MEQTKEQTMDERAAVLIKRIQHWNEEEDKARDNDGWALGDKAVLARANKIKLKKALQELIDAL